MNFHDLIITRIGRAILGELRARGLANTLHRFDDRLLADMGISRGEIDGFVRGRRRRRA
jgi:uncharacterized protein YjiS (DUF1127 family)